MPHFPHLPLAACSNWTKFAGAWGLLVAGIAFYDGEHSGAARTA